MPFKAKNNREAVVVCAIHVVKRPSKRSVLVETKMGARLREVAVSWRSGSRRFDCTYFNCVLISVLDENLK